MPIYEYECSACRAKFDQLQRSMSRESAVKCPKCGSPKTARTLSVFAVGAESAPKSSGGDAGPGMCGRCGGPGPCAMG